MGWFTIIDIQKLKDALLPEDIIELVTYLGADRFVDYEKMIVFPTICHNTDPKDAKMKLWYYKDSKLFHCFTECGESFDIYGLFIRVLELLQGEYNFYKDVVKIIAEKVGFSIHQEKVSDFDSFVYTSEKDRFSKKRHSLELPVVSKNVLNVFPQITPQQWISEGMSEATLAEYGIRFSIDQNKIIIPHFDINNNLVGIRGRALNSFELEQGYKYMPVQIENKWYAHPLASNLYGINKIKEKKLKEIIIFEGEKSVLLYHSIFGKTNAVAVCGYSINKSQIELLIKNFEIDEIILAFDKEYSNYNSKKGEAYYNRLRTFCKKYGKYAQMSFLFDRENYIAEKSSPIDHGKEPFLNLIKKRIKY